MHPAKRRRMDNAASALTKPFRSPLHVNPDKQRPSPEKQDDQVPQVSQCTTPNKTTQPDTIPHIPSPIASSAESRTRRNPRRYGTGDASPTKSPLSPRDVEYNALRKQHSALTLQLKELTTSLDTVTQALAVTQSTQDHDLRSLITKWQVASREAAEDLFATAKDQISCMGGTGVWRDRYMTPSEQSPWSNNPEMSQHDLSAEQKEQLEIANDEAKAESEKYGLYQDHPSANVADNDSFTMEMMLRQLNVDLGVIEFNTETQEWIH